MKSNRRSFIKTSAVTGGGLILGFNFFSSCKEDTVAKVVRAVPKAWKDINAFIKIADTGLVTIMSPNPEIGQGVKTSMPMIIAEELDVAWEDVVVEQAGYDGKAYDRQVAGGSQSIRHGWTSLRQAGATVRQMLVDAAAKQWEVASKDCTTENGVISHKESQRSIGYGELVMSNEEWIVPEETTLKDPKDFKIIGKAKNNVDNEKLVTGKPLFGIDIQKEGMKIAMMVEGKAFGNKLVDFDAAPIEAMPGILKVVQFYDIIGIVGESTWQVMKAKKAVKATFTNDGQTESSAAQAQQMTEALAKKPKEATRKDGDADAMIANAAKVFEQTYESPYWAHNTMEPMNFYANVTADKVELEGPIQTPAWTVSKIQKILDVPEEQISIMMTRMGGGFGRRLYGNFVGEAAQISKLSGYPVKLIYTREDDMMNGMYRPNFKMTYTAALDENNQLLGIRVRGASMAGKDASFAAGAGSWGDRFPAGALDNYLVEQHILKNDVSTAAWRAPVSNFEGFSQQCFMDELAAELGKDPIDLQLELLERAKANPVGEFEYDPQRMIDTIKLVRAKGKWGAAREGISQGFSAYYSHNSYVAQIAEAEMRDGKPVITKVHCAVDCGIVVNPSGANQQCVGGIIDGIGHSMYAKLTLTDGVPDQQNFDQYRMIKMPEAPSVEVHFVESNESPTGLGEPTLPPIGGAIGNALSAALGKRLRKQPFVEFI